MNAVTDPNPSPEQPQQVRPLKVTIILWVAKLGAIAILGVAGYWKLTGNPSDIETFTTLEMEPAGRYLIGVLELTAAALMLMRQSAIYGAFLGLGIMCGAIIGEVTKLGNKHLPQAILVAVLCLVILYIRRRDAPFIGNLLDH